MSASRDDDDELAPLTELSPNEANLAICRATCEELRARLAQRDATVRRLVEERRQLAEVLRILLASK